jgi:poly(A) polymerase
MILEKVLIISRNGISEDEIPNVFSLHEIAQEKIELLHEIIVQDHADIGLSILQKTGFLGLIIPEINEAAGFNKSGAYKKIWPHTLKVLMQTPPKIVLRWAALFHDLGKTKSFAKDKGKISFHHHEHISAKIFKSFSERIPDLFDRHTFHRIHRLIYNLGYVESYDSSWTDSAVRRFAKDIGKGIDDLFALSQADITTENPAKKEKCIRESSFFRQRIQDIQVFDEKNKSNLPKGIGLEISNVFVIPLSKKIGIIKDYLENKIKEQELLGLQEVQYYIDILKKDESWKCLVEVS